MLKISLLFKKFTNFSGITQEFVALRMRNFHLFIYLFVYLFILYLKVDKHIRHIKMCLLKKWLSIKLKYIHAN